MVSIYLLFRAHQWSAIRSRRHVFAFAHITGYGSKHYPGTPFQVNSTYANFAMDESLDFLVNHQTINAAMWMLPAGKRSLDNPYVLVNETSQKNEGVWLARDWRERVDVIVAAVADAQSADPCGVCGGGRRVCAE